jgi:glutaredoxin
MRRLRRRPSEMTGRHEGSSGARARVTLYTAVGCHLCERARQVLADARADVEFDLHEVDITNDEALEASYREWIPVVEIDGRRRFTYFVQPDAFRKAVAQAAT